MSQPDRTAVVVPFPRSPDPERSPAPEEPKRRRDRRFLAVLAAAVAIVAAGGTVTTVAVAQAREPIVKEPTIVQSWPPVCVWRDGPDRGDLPLCPTRLSRR